MVPVCASGFPGRSREQFRFNKNIYRSMNEYPITRIKTDVNGNPRRVIHFLAFITDNDRGGTGAHFPLGSLYEIALKKARKLGGRKFHNKQYGGGIVFQAYSDDEVYELVARANAAK